MKELKLEELSIRQKLGMTFTAFINGSSRTPEEDAFILDLIKNHSLGCVWVQVDRDGILTMVFPIVPFLLHVDRGSLGYPVLGVGDNDIGRLIFFVNPKSVQGKTVRNGNFISVSINLV